MPQPAGTSRIDNASDSGRAPLRVGVVLADHFTLSAFAVFIDHLRLAADEGDRSRPLHAQWSIMACNRQPVRASCGVVIEPTSDLLAPESLDYLVVIGGILHAGPQVDEATNRYLREAAAHVPLIGVCTGSFVLCRAGLMKGRRTCVSWYHYQDFLEAFPDHEVVADRLFLVDGPRITCAGGAGTAALATYLIGRHLGPAVAHKASQVLLFDRPRSGSEAQPHPPVSEAVSEQRVRRALLLMEQNLTRPITITHVAAELGVSVRQLERLCREHAGLTPAALYRQLRLRYANWLIENTDRSVTEIAIEAGFADCAHFSRQFKGAFGLSPTTRRLQPDRSVQRDAAGSRVFE
ncbi:MAG TPA: GlxA family transcriptional regulator [Steroidobacteraceae bacterium]|jgi:transcriptional regulator GlxA family with amidase domain